MTAKAATWRSADGRAKATVTRAGAADRQGRPRFRYLLERDGATVATDDDLRGPACGDEPALRYMLRTLGSFVGAWAEATRYEAAHPGRDSDNAGIFPPEAAAWAAYADEFSDAMALEETP